MTEGLEELGIVVDTAKNLVSRTKNAETDISEKNSMTKIFVIPTDEELVMVEDTVALLEKRYDVHTNFKYSFQDPFYTNKLRDDAFKNEVKKNSGLYSVKAAINTN
jgi:acetate kinase